jgi:23S rRNA pseudouridine1911/1915/1917 synthase
MVFIVLTRKISVLITGLSISSGCRRDRRTTNQSFELFSILHIPMVMLRIGFLTVLHIQWFTEAFIGNTLSSHRVSDCSQLPWSKSTTCYAKPDPRGQFDLEAIEALEVQLDKHRVGVENDFDELEDDDIENGDSLTLNVKTHVIPDELDNTRIDKAVAMLEPELSRSCCGTLVTDGFVRVVSASGNEEVIDRKSFKVESGTILKVFLPVEHDVSEIVAQDLPLEILYEDEHMIAINKAAGMVVHPAAGNWDGTVVNALAFYLSTKSPYGAGDFVDQVEAMSTDLIATDDMDGEKTLYRPGVVHRLDKGTTGVLIVAKTREALVTLSEAFAARKIKKTYIAITVGNPGKSVTIDKPIGRHPIHRQRMRVVPNADAKNSRPGMDTRRKGDRRPTSNPGRRALSFVDTIAFDGKLGIVQVRIETGRTHQIRVHLQDRHTPIYGDDVYGLPDWNKRLSKIHGIERPLLHAQRLELRHPITGEMLVIEASLPDDMKRIVETIAPPNGESGYCVPT